MFVVVVVVLFLLLLLLFCCFVFCDDVYLNLIQIGTNEKKMIIKFLNLSTPCLYIHLL